MQRVLGGALVVLTLLLAWLWPRGGDHWGGDGRGDRRGDEVSGGPSNDLRAVPTDSPMDIAPAQRSALDVNPSDAGLSDSEAPQVEIAELHASELRAQLEAVARAEQRVLGAASAAAADSASGAAFREAQDELERALTPLLYEPSNLYRALDMLRSGELAVVVEQAGANDAVSLAEFGAVRSIYWALLAYSAPASDLNQVGAGVPPTDLLHDVLTALPELRERVQGMLLDQLTEARLDGALVLDTTSLATILYLRSQFPEHRELFSGLLANLGEAMTPGERDAVFSVLLDEDADPTLVGVALTNLLRGASGGASMKVAEALYDSESGGAEANSRRREAIAKAVAASSTDPYEAAQFLAERSDQTRNMVEAYWTLGERDGGLEALEAQYFALSSDDVNPRARLALVLGMSRAPAEQLLGILDTDSDPGVRGQALLTLTSAEHYAPRQEHVDLMRIRRDGARSLPIGALIGAATNIANHARSSGDGELARSAIALLKDLGLEARTTPHERRRITDTLKSQLDSAAFEVWLAQCAGLDER